MLLNDDSTHQRLALVLRWLSPTIIGFAIAYAVMGDIFQDWRAIVSACSIGTHGLLTMLAQFQLCRGHQHRAAYLVGGGAVGSILIITALQPVFYPSLVVVPFLIAAMLLQYAPLRHTWYYLAGCCAASILVIFVGEAAPGVTRLPASIVDLLRLSSLIAIIVFALLMLGQFSSRLQDMLARLREAYSALGAQHAKLARLSYQHELILNSAGEGIYGVDAQGILTFVNPTAATMFGWEVSELIGQLMHTCTHRTQADGEACPILTCPMCAVLEEGLVQRRTDEVFWRKDGTSFPVEYVSAPIREHGEIAGAVVLFRDITERKQAEAALEAERALLSHRVAERTADLSVANAELARAARLKDEFLASMSHELRTPLNAILGLSETLQEQIYGTLTSEQQRALQGVEESGRHLLTLINDILDLAKIGAGKLELQLGPVAVESLCKASLRFVQHGAHKKQISIETAIDPTAIALNADMRRLKQILVNLLSNAVKFTPVGGRVGLEVIGDASQEVVHLVVWDTGIGIAQADMSRLFQPFVQLDSRLARQYNGTGLGLALVYRFAELHGGRVAVTSEPGSGSRFTVSLPWQASDRIVASAGGALAQELLPGDRPMAGSTPQIEAPSGVAERPRRLARPTILLVEDSEANITALSDYLEAKDYQVVVARGGAEAIARAPEVRPALILMDIQMPDVDGLEATQRIRADARVSNVPIIALTALAMPGDRDRCLEAGANEYISKPVRLCELVATIEQYLYPAQSE